MRHYIFFPNTAIPSYMFPETSITLIHYIVPSPLVLGSGMHPSGVDELISNRFGIATFRVSTWSGMVHSGRCIREKDVDPLCTHVVPLFCLTYTFSIQFQSDLKCSNLKCKSQVFLLRHFIFRLSSAERSPLSRFFHFHFQMKFIKSRLLFSSKE